MKVLHVLNELKFSGAEIMYVDAAPVFQELGCELTVLNTANKMGEYSIFFESAGYEVIHFPIASNRFKQWRMCKEIMKLIRNFDVVHIHRHDLYCVFSYCAWRVGVKSIYTAHNVFRSHWYSYPLHLLQHLFAEKIYHCKLQTISDSVDTNEKEYFHAKTCLVYNWYGCNRFYPAFEGEKALIREELKIAPDALVIISVGGCSDIKRHHDVIKALALVLKKYPKAIYLHLGEGVTLEEEKQLAESLSVIEHIRFCGNQTDVRKYLVASDVYVMPSRFEGIPITTIEAMATGIPCVLYDVPGLSDFNQSMITSVMIPEDYHCMAESICNLIEDEETRKRNIDAALNLVHNKYYMKKNVQKIFSLYKPIGGGN